MNHVTSSEDSPQGPKPGYSLMVWDLPLRLFHWFLVATVSILLITGFLAEESWLSWHEVAGYGLGILIAFRLVWGLIGSLFSRYDRFPLQPGLAINHLKQLIQTKSTPQTLGHNPVGAWMIVILMALLMTLIASGLVTLGGQERLGPLAAITSFDAGQLAAEVHEFAAWGLLAAIVVHLAGVLVETFVLKHPILKAMLTGRKPVNNGSAASEALPRQKTKPENQGIRGLATMVVTASIVLAAGGVMATIRDQGWHPVQLPKAYESNCADCHDLYHPSLRKAEDWATIMAGLDRHYGEDASLGGDTVATIQTFLMAHSATHFETEAAHMIGRVSSPQDRMTTTPYWKQRHHDIPKAAFSNPKVGSNINCKACHQDALTGRFLDANIQIPKGPKT